MAILIVSPPTGRWGQAFGALLAIALLILTIDVALSPRLQRGNWRGLAAVLHGGPQARAITTVELGSAPLEYYLGPLHNLRPGAAVVVSEIDETGYAPLRGSAGEPPRRGFHLVERRNVDGLIAYRFRSARPLPGHRGRARANT